MTSMDCLNFEDRLDMFEAGTLSSEEREAAEKHLRSCARCRTLHGMVHGDPDLLPAESQQDLALSILDRTSGPACHSAEGSLCEWVDGALSGVDLEIISLHVAHCSECSALAASLRELKEVLPSMAEIEPDAAFTAEVLSATGPQIGAKSTEPARKPREFWNRLIRRPRFAWEAAYVGALLILLALGNPANIPRFMPRTTAVPQLLIRSGNQLLQETTTVFGERRMAAKRSLSNLEFHGKSLLETAADFQNRTTMALRMKASSIFNELKVSLSGGKSTGEQQQELR